MFESLGKLYIIRLTKTIHILLIINISTSTIDSAIGPSQLNSICYKHHQCCIASQGNLQGHRERAEEVGSMLSAAKNIFSVQSIFEYVCTLSTCSTVRSRSFE